MATADLRYDRAPERRERALELIRRDGFVTTSELAAELGVSEMTVRRDLQRLEEGGEVRVVPGGVSVRTAAGGTDFRLRLITEEAEKRAIGELAATLVPEGAVVGIDAGSTALEVLRHLAVDTGLTVVTQSLPAMNEAAARRDLELMALGGVLRPEAGSFSGPATVAQVSQLHLDVAFIGATALRDGESLCGNPYDAETKRAMRSSAHWAALVIDSSKFDRTAMMRILPVARYDAVVVDDGLADGDLEALRSLDLAVHVAPVEER